TGQNDLTSSIHTRLRIAAVIPTLVVGPHDMQFGIRKVALRLVVGGILHRLRGFASTCRARPLAFSLRCGAALTLDVRFRLAPRLQASHGGLNPRQTILSAR